MKHVKNAHRLKPFVTNVLTALLLAVFVQFIATVYAMAFTLSTSTPETNDTREILMADFDGDGDMDYVALNDNDTHDIYLNDGSGLYGGSAITGTSDDLYDARAGDIDNDGDVDFIAVDVAAAIKKYTNDGYGSFTQGTVAFLPTSHSAVALFDVDNDGDLDAVYGSVNENTTLIYLNDGTGTFASATSTLPRVKTLDVADMNSDGFQDLVAVLSTGQITTFINSGTGAFVSLNTPGSLVTAGGLADFDGDGDIDALGANISNHIFLYSNNGAGTLNESTISTAPGSDGEKTFAPADLDNDGDIDFLVSSIDTTGSNGGAKAWFNNSFGVFTAGSSPTEGSDDTYGAAVGDIDGDSDLDYVRGNGGTTANRHYKSDQAATSANTAPTAPSASTMTGAMSTITPKGGSTFADDTSIGTCTWSNTDRVVASDDSRSTCGTGTNADTHYLKATGFNFAIPTGATITGIKVEIEAGANYFGGVTENSIKIVKGGTITGTEKSTGRTMEGPSVEFAPPIDAYYSYGGSTDLWGLTWTAADINSSSFGIAASYHGAYAGSSAVVDHMRITVYYGVNDIRLSWGSGSDSQTSTRLLQYQVRVGTSSGGKDVLSSAVGSPNYTTRMMPNGQSKNIVLKALDCGRTYYWNVATVDSGFKTTWGTEQFFVLNSSCGLSFSQSTSAVTNGGGGLDFRIFKTKDESGGGGDLYRLTVSAVSDVNGNRKRDSREQTLALKGLQVTASGTSLSGLPVRKTALLSSTGVAIFDLPISGPRGYSISFDSGALAKTGYKATGALTLTGIVLRPSASTNVTTNLTVTLPFRRDDLLRYSPCLTVGDPPENEAPGTDAEILLQRLRDPYGKSILGKISLSGSLMTRGDFFTLLQRMQCVPIETNRAMLSLKLKSAARELDESIVPIDVPSNATADSLMVYSLLGTGADILRTTSIGPAADLSSPITRSDAMRAVASILRVPKTLVTETGSELLPLDIEPKDPAASDFFALRSIGALPQNFIDTPGINQGITSSEAALLLARAAFRNGKISLLPDIQNPKTAKKAPLVATFLKDLPTIKMSSCLERHEERSAAVSFTDLLPGDPRHAEIKELLTRGIKNAADQTLWLIPGNRRPTEFGIAKGQTKLGIDEPISVLETVRNLLVFACLAPDTRTQALAGLSVKEVTQGTGETRTARDRLSNLPRDASFASRVMYRAQDRLKEFDLSLVRYAPALLLQETRLPGETLNLKDASDLMASALLMTMVRQGALSPQRAEELEGAVSAAMSRQLLGKEVNWRDEGMLKNTVFTRGMLLEFLSTALQNKRFIAAQKISSLLPLGEIWWERVK